MDKFAGEAMDRQTHTEIEQLKSNISLLSTRVTNVERALSLVNNLQSFEPIPLAPQTTVCQANEVKAPVENTHNHMQVSQERQLPIPFEENLYQAKNRIERLRTDEKSAGANEEKQNHEDLGFCTVSLKDDQNSSARPKTAYEKVRRTTGVVETSTTEPQRPIDVRRAKDNLNNAKKNSLEQEIGLYWLNRLGITSLVIGIALLLMYSFQYFGSVAKIASGFMIAAAFLVGGEWMENRGGPKWYARSLMGGGWAVAYFTVFAMHHIPAVKVIADQNLECVLLYAVAFCAMRHCIWKRSELTALFALVLGLVTFALSEPSIASALASAVLVESVCTLSRKLNWTRLYFGGLLGSYCTASYIIDAKISHLALDSVGQFHITAAYLGLFWASYLVTSLSMGEESPWRRRLLVASAFLNFLFFAPYMTSMVHQLYPKFDSAFVLAVAIVYAFAAYAARSKAKAGLEQVYTLGALTLATASIPMILKSDWSIVFLLMEIPVLVFLGLQNNIKAFRIFAHLLLPISVLYLFCNQSKLLDGSHVFEAAIHCGLAALSYSATAVCYRRWRDLQGIVSEYSGLAFYVYGILASCFATALPSIMASLAGLSENYKLEWPINILSWLVCSAFYYLMGLKLKDKLLQQAPVFLIGFNTLAICASTSYFASWAAAWAVGIVYGMAALVRHKPGILSDHQARTHMRAYITLASLLVASVTATYFDSSKVLLWSYEALVTVFLGLYMKDRYIQTLGGIWFITMSLNLLGTIGQWQLFQVAGLIAAFYAAAHLNRQHAKTESSQGHVITARWYEAGAATITTMLMLQHVPSNCLAFAWSLQGLALLTFGFLRQDKPSRLYGLAVFALVGSKLLFVDLAGAETPQRIVSFMVAGVVLMISSYAYSIFEKRFAAQTDETEQPVPANSFRLQ